MNHWKYILLILTLSTLSINAAQSSPLLITLQLPSGAENTGLGESGVSLANTLHSVFWNPANVSCLYESQYVNTIYSSFKESIAGNYSLSHDFYGISATINDLSPFVDIGYAYFNNHVSGDNMINSNNISSAPIVSDETVTSHCIGIRGFDLLSFGVSFKQYDSRLSANDNSYSRNFITMSAKGNAIDFGFRLNKKVDILGLFYVNPSIGVSALNFVGDSADYKGFKGPLPKLGFLGGSYEVNLLELYGFTYIFEMQFDLLTKPNQRTRHTGYSMQITPFYTLVRGTMIDTAGKRYENSDGYVVTVNLRKTFLMLSKIVKLVDILNHSDHYAAFTKWDDGMSVRGVNFKPNFYFSKSHSKISGFRTVQVRDGQQRDDWSIGLGVVGSFFGAERKSH